MSDIDTVYKIYKSGQQTQGLLDRIKERWRCIETIICDSIPKDTDLKYAKKIEGEEYILRVDKSGIVFDAGDTDFFDFSEADPVMLVKYSEALSKILSELLNDIIDISNATKMALRQLRWTESIKVGNTELEPVSELSEKAMIILFQMGISDPKEAGNFSKQELCDAGAAPSTVKTIRDYLASYGLSLKGEVVNEIKPDSKILLLRTLGLRKGIYRLDDLGINTFADLNKITEYKFQDATRASKTTMTKIKRTMQRLNINFADKTKSRS